VSDLFGIFFSFSLGVIFLTVLPLTVAKRPVLEGCHQFASASITKTVSTEMVALACAALC